MSKRIRLSKEVKDIAIAAYSKCGILAVAAKAAGETRAALYRESKRSPRFKAAMEEAKGNFTDMLEAILNKRILDGTDKMSAILLMFALKAQMPEKYRERIDHQVEGNIKIISGVPRPPDTRITTAEKVTPLLTESVNLIDTPD